MNLHDESRHVGVAAGVDGDTCDTSIPAVPTANPSTAGERRSSADEGVSWRARRTHKGAVHPGDAVRRPLLDHPYETREHPSDFGAFERRARWELLACIHPALEDARSSALDLLSVNFTAAEVDTFEQTIEALAQAVASDPLAGVLLVHELGGKGGRLHCHGLALAPSTRAVTERWARLTGAGAEPPRVKSVSYWGKFCAQAYERNFGVHLYRVISYASKPWPEGARSLEAHYVASGCFAAPLRAFRARMGALVPPEGGSPVDASPACRPCAWCSKPLPANARADMERHDACRRQASKAKRRAERAAAQRK